MARPCRGKRGVLVTMRDASCEKAGPLALRALRDVGFAPHHPPLAHPTSELSLGHSYCSVFVSVMSTIHVTPLTGDSTCATCDT